MWPLNVFFRFWRKRLSTPNTMIWLSMDWQAIHLSEEKTKRFGWQEIRNERCEACCFLVPTTLLLAGGALARETKGSGDKGFPVLNSGTSSLHVCSREVAIYCMGESWRFLLPLKISLFQTANQNNQINSKILCPQSPSFLVPRPCRLREAKRATRTRMGVLALLPSRHTSRLWALVPNLASSENQITHGCMQSGLSSWKYKNSKDSIELENDSLLGWRVTAGIECMLGSAIYLKSTGMSLK